MSEATPMSTATQPATTVASRTDNHIYISIDARELLQQEQAAGKASNSITIEVVSALHNMLVWKKPTIQNCLELQSTLFQLAQLFNQLSVTGETRREAWICAIDDVIDPSGQESRPVRLGTGNIIQSILDRSVQSPTSFANAPIGALHEAMMIFGRKITVELKKVQGQGTNLSPSGVEDNPNANMTNVNPYDEEPNLPDAYVGQLQTGQLSEMPVLLPRRTTTTPPPPPMGISFMNIKSEEETGPKKGRSPPKSRAFRLRTDEQRLSLLRLHQQLGSDWVEIAAAFARTHCPKNYFYSSDRARKNCTALTQGTSLDDAIKILELEVHDEEERKRQTLRSIVLPKSAIKDWMY